jgi:hypothetical protein
MCKYFGDESPRLGVVSSSERLEVGRYLVGHPRLMFKGIILKRAGFLFGARLLRILMRWMNAAYLGNMGTEEGALVDPIRRALIRSGHFGRHLLSSTQSIGLV